MNPKERSPYEDAVVIDAEDTLAGVRAEKGFIARFCGERGKDWKMERQSLVEHNGKPYDVIVIALSSGETRTYYFDVSSFFGK